MKEKADKQMDCIYKIIGVKSKMCSYCEGRGVYFDTKDRYYKDCCIYKPVYEVKNEFEELYKKLLLLK